MLLVWVVGGLSFKLCVDVCLCPLPQHPLTFTHGGGKPLGGNPSSTVWKPSSHRVNPYGNTLRSTGKP